MVRLARRQRAEYAILFTSVVTTTRLQRILFLTVSAHVHHFYVTSSVHYDGGNMLLPVLAWAINSQMCNNCTSTKKLL